MNERKNDSEKLFVRMELGSSPKKQEGKGSTQQESEPSKGRETNGGEEEKFYNYCLRERELREVSLLFVDHE